jgi:hypothetical protein
MKILKLEKIKLGDYSSIIRVTYKTLFEVKQRDAIKGYSRWMWADTGSIISNYYMLEKFDNSPVNYCKLNK